MSTFIQFIADYGTGDPAFSEVIQKIVKLDPSARIQQTSVPKFSTLATGLWTGQFAAINQPEEFIIYTNTAPRKDNKESRERNEGEKLVYAKLESGIRIVGVNAGYCFSFVKNQIEDLHIVNVENKGSQFRSRDFYPEAVVGIAQGDTAFIREARDPSTIPDVPERQLAWVDGYGNLKTTVRSSTVDFTPGQAVRIELNKIVRTAYFTNGTFSVHEGQIAYAPGSTGGDDPFMEIFLRGLSAWREFGRPYVEQSFTVEAIDS